MKKACLVQCIFKKTDNAVLFSTEFIVVDRICSSAMVRAIGHGLFLTPFREG